jgi:hypothetical protein
MGERFGRVPGLLDEVNQPLYDTLELASGTATYRFFTVPVSGAKSRLLTNMTLQGQLPAPQSFKVMAIRVIAKSATADASTAIVNHALMFSYLVFKVGEKEQVVEPTVLASAGAGVYNNITTDIAQNGMPDARSIAALNRPITIGVSQNFYLDLIYDTAPTTAQDGIKILVVLDGVLTRGVQ